VEFAIRFAAPMRVLMTLMGSAPGVSGIRVLPDGVEVRMGISFRATVPRAAIRVVERDRRRYISIGVHGWAGRWLVNGSLKGLVRIQIAPPARARVLGVPVRLRELIVSAEDPEGLIAALR
jgi:hypothetical protein